MFPSCLLLLYCLFIVMLLEHWSAAPLWARMEEASASVESDCCCDQNANHLCRLRVFIGYKHTHTHMHTHLHKLTALSVGLGPAHLHLKAIISPNWVTSWTPNVMLHPFPAFPRKARLLQLLIGCHRPVRGSRMRSRAGCRALWLTLQAGWSEWWFHRKELSVC